ncbi:FKBP-type peptidyl-prolyl cis-trans isomerase [Polluticoccus soli]|uniref:FKBP-type peptidyl-prolyl cis-trans isomerase n=1 Tax=Polluticoccus soli TaxID=3034150 RepID=UPI0023E10019|nr:FKBP-type peptidyl-prolyl cis-trans isomerase [Flavipsychrobacter sp. JY13-12]
MTNRFVPVAMLSVAVLGFGACKSGGSYKKTKEGLEYNIIKDEKGDRKPIVGDVVAMHITIRYKDDKTDTVLLRSRDINSGQPAEFVLGPAQFKGAWEEGITMLTAGDSASFRVPVDSIKKASGGQMPPFMKDGQKIQYDVVLVSVKSQAEAEQQMKSNAGKQAETDDRIIQEYLTKNNITAQKTASGLYYVVEKEGTGATPQKGQAVSVNYTGKTLDGKPFDSNVDPQFQHTDPFQFNVGQGMVIPGWDEGIMLLKKGSKAKLFVPSPLAYGPQGNGPIAPNSVLLFDVELLDIK